MELSTNSVVMIYDIKLFKIVQVKDTVNNIDHKGMQVTEIVFMLDDRRYKVVKYTEALNKCNYSVLEMYVYNRESNRYDMINKKNTYDVNSIRLTDISKFTPKHPTYSNIDKRQLLITLTYYGLVGGVYTGIVDTYVKQQREIRSKIKQLKSQISTLEESEKNIKEKLFEPTGKGSKLTDKNLLIQLSERHSDKALSKGTYVERYNACIGDRYSLYGGILTDLYGLPYGTDFEVTNGNWMGTITYDKHADKAVGVIGDARIVKITDENRFLYINIIDNKDWEE